MLIAASVIAHRGAVVGVGGRPGRNRGVGPDFDLSIFGQHVLGAARARQIGPPRRRPAEQAVKDRFIQRRTSQSAK